jgi:hypothetical protein
MKEIPEICAPYLYSPIVGWQWIVGVTIFCAFGVVLVYLMIKDNQ